MAARPERVPAEEVRRRMLEAGRELAIEAPYRANRGSCT